LIASNADDDDKSSAITFRGLPPNECVGFEFVDCKAHGNFDNIKFA
jgi:hypothetical protein